MEIKSDEWCETICKRSPCNCNYAICKCCMICFFDGTAQDKRCWVNCKPNEDVYFRFLLIYNKEKRINGCHTRI